MRTTGHVRGPAQFRQPKGRVIPEGPNPHEPAPTLVWLRRDLRLSDNEALTAAGGEEGPVIPVFILDPETEALGAAAKWRLGLSIADLRVRLTALGSGLVLRRGDAVAILSGLAAETGARSAHWSRLHSPDTVIRDKAVKSALAAAGVKAKSHPGHLLHEPWEPETKAGGFFKVYTPFWNAVRRRAVAAPLSAPRRIAPPGAWPRSDDLDSWNLGAAMDRGAHVVARHVRVGEDAALCRLEDFVTGPLQDYARDRDRPDRAATSGLSENLTYGEISPRTIWSRTLRAREEGARGAEKFLKELVWREFAWHLLWHTPELAERSWRPEWDAFPWRGDNPDAERWRRGMTGEPMVDAGMREMYVTGTMHNRVRMLAASYLTKHLLTDWRVGLAWFADCLIDWDPASNAMGWQWVAGSGPDSAPFFRVFNPRLQAEKFDPRATYRRRFVAELADGQPGEDALEYFRAVPRSWSLDSAAPYPKHVIALQEGREAALSAYREWTSGRTGGDVE